MSCQIGQAQIVPSVPLVENLLFMLVRGERILVIPYCVLEYGTFQSHIRTTNPTGSDRARLRKNSMGREAGYIGMGNWASSRGRLNSAGGLYQVWRAPPMLAISGRMAAEYPTSMTPVATIIT